MLEYVRLSSLTRSFYICPKGRRAFLRQGVAEKTPLISPLFASQGGERIASSVRLEGLTYKANLPKPAKQ